MKILVMGVAGCGKSTFGHALAIKLGLPFFDADNFHSPESVAKMANGQPLCDNDRWPWLEKLATLFKQEHSLVLSCSALKKQYREFLHKAGGSDYRLCYLQGDFATILQRLELRSVEEGHFFSGEAMLRSQWETLEKPTKDENPLVVSVELSVAEQVQQACQWYVG